MAIESARQLRYCFIRIVNYYFLNLNRKNNLNHWIIINWYYEC